ncbi:MAG: hypothetical protein IPK85_02570 [Gemmatimonadetes bacterium]|nr:hypothetical protein [Gemmatimonadota bacterium]
MGWNPADHPRYPNGKFRPKFSQSVRLSPISVSYNAGVRVPIVPGRANLYLGALARVERSGRSGGFFQQHIDRAVHAVSGKLGDPHGRSNIAQLLKGHEINTKGGLRVTGPTKLVNAPTFRVSSTPASREKGFELQKAGEPRSARRRPRSRSAAVPSTISQGVRTQKPKAITKGPKRVRKSSTRGRKVRR